MTDEERERVINEWLPADIREAKEDAAKYDDRGGISFIMDTRLVSNLRQGKQMDMDVYDLAEWCCISELGSISIKNGCAPVEVPDFTRGAWNKVDGFKYAFSDGSFR